MMKDLLYNKLDFMNTCSDKDYKTWHRTKITRLGIEQIVFEQNDIHVHVLTNK